MAEEAGKPVKGSIIDRQCTIEIANECTNYSLRNPRIFIETGSCARPLSPVIGPSKADTALFVKPPVEVRGCAAVFTYDLLKKDEDQSTEKMAVMFSVPFDFNLYKNIYAVGIFEMSKKCDHDLYNYMLHNSGPEFVRGEAESSPSLTHEGKSVTIMATMSDSYQPVIKLQVHSTS